MFKAVAAKKKAPAKKPAAKWAKATSTADWMVEGKLKGLPGQGPASNDKPAARKPKSSAAKWSKATATADWFTEGKVKGQSKPKGLPNPKGLLPNGLSSPLEDDIDDGERKKSTAKWAAATLTSGWVTDERQPVATVEKTWALPTKNHLKVGPEPKSGVFPLTAADLKSLQNGGTPRLSSKNRVQVCLV